jgi:hypothetical protein
MAKNDPTPAPVVKIDMTPAEFAAVDDATRFYLVKKAAADKAKADLDEARAKLLEVTKPFVTEARPQPFSGLTFGEKKTVRYDKDAALEFLLKDEYIGAAPDMLTIRDGSIGILIGAAITHPALRSIFDIRDSGYQHAVKNKYLRDMPYDGIDTEQTLAVTTNAVKVGAELRATVNLITDAE